MSTAPMQRLTIKTTINDGYCFFGLASPNPAGPVANHKKSRRDSSASLCIEMSR